MPIYEYACQKCGHEFDALQKVADGPLRKCPACGALRLKRLVSAPSFRLKGTGWYETDFKKDGKRKLAVGDDTPAGDADKKDESKADAKEKKEGGTGAARAEAKAGKSAEKGQEKSQEKSQEKGQKKDEKQNEKQNKGGSAAKPAASA